MPSPGDILHLNPNEIIVPDGRRQVDQAVVRRLAESIEKLGLLNPITVRERAGEHILVAGLHRLEAHKRLKRPGIRCLRIKLTNDEARMAEISENLHRSDLTKLERDGMVGECISLSAKAHEVQTAPHRRAGQQPGGISAAARELGIEETDAKRAVRVASLSDEAKEAAREHGLDDNRSALLTAAKETTPEKQVARIIEIQAQKAAPRPQNPRDKTKHEDKLRSARHFALSLVSADRALARRLGQALEAGDFQFLKLLAKEIRDGLGWDDEAAALAELAAQNSQRRLNS